MDDSEGIRCMLMRGGTSKGAYFLADDLPHDPAERADLLLRILGSPDPRQIDGIGGAHPLTSKVAIVSRSDSPDADVDYLFLQVAVDEPLVSDAQTCGNLLAGVGPFAIERGLFEAAEATTDIRIRVLNGEPSIAVATLQTPGRRASYAGDTLIAGVPFGSAPVAISIPTGENSLFPTGRLVDTFGDVDATCVNAGMPVVIVTAASLGLRGDESPEELESDARVRAEVERIRLAAGRAMGLGDVSDTTVPKVTIASAPGDGGSIRTRTFIPKRVHTSIGVLGAVSVAAACRVPGTVVHPIAVDGEPTKVEHPTGSFDALVRVDLDGAAPRLGSAAVIRTARKLFDGRVWPRDRT